MLLPSPFRLGTRYESNIREKRELLLALSFPRLLLEQSEIPVFSSVPPTPNTPAAVKRSTTFVTVSKPRRFGWRSRLFLVRNRNKSYSNSDLFEEHVKHTFIM